MRMELTKEYRFEAAHRLPQVPADHKCSRMHGHGLSRRDHDRGRGRSADGLGGRLRRHHGEGRADHQARARSPRAERRAGLENPTSEMLAAWLWRRLAPELPGLTAITVHETCTARCTYRGG
jgi:6-pyruvoyltetrahydropterin/6-carboxytetrahydropterin synthase